MVSLVQVVENKVEEVGAPSLRRHCRGGFFVRLPSRQGSKWFGSDPDQALRLYQAWRAGFGAGYPQRMPVQKHRSTNGTRRRVGADMEHLLNAPVSQIVDFFVARKTAEVSERSRLNWAQRLKRFRDQLGHLRLNQVRGAQLDGFRMTLAGKRPNYANTILNHVRAFLVWTFEVGLAEQPWRLKEVLKDFKKKPIPYKGKPPEVVREIIQKVCQHDRALAFAMFIQYRACLRPSELGRLGNEIKASKQIQKTYEIFSKTSTKVGSPRTVLIADDLIPLLEKNRGIWGHPKDDCLKGIKREGAVWWAWGAPVWSENAYRLKLRRMGALLRSKDSEALSRHGWKNLTGHWLRHSSAQHCVNLDLPESHVRLILGRARPAVDRHYVNGEAWEPARQSIGRLAQSLPGSILGDK